MERATEQRAARDDNRLQLTGKGPLVYPLFPSEDADAVPCQTTHVTMSCF